MKKVLTYPGFWPVAIWFFFDLAIFFSFGGLWGGPYLMQVYGLSKAKAGHILSMLAIGMIVGSPFLSFLSDRIFRGRKPVLLLSSFIVLCLTALLAFYTEQLSIISLYLLCLALGVFSSAIVVIGFTTTKELFPVQIAGTSTGLVNIFPFAGGAVFQPLLGYLLERPGKAGDAFYFNRLQAGFSCTFPMRATCLPCLPLSKRNSSQRLKNPGRKDLAFSCLLRRLQWSFPLPQYSKSARHLYRKSDSNLTGPAGPPFLRLN